MVEKYPLHNNEDEIVSKIWMIGRTYAAAIERRQNKDNISNDIFYYDYVAPKLKNSDIDARINALKQHHKISTENLPEILSVHKYLTEDIFKELTQKGKRSLASKYLHFHLPNLFFIYDSRVASVITEFTGKKPRNLQIPDDSDKAYAEFCYKALSIYDNLIVNYPDSKPRVIDNILLRYCDEIGLSSNEEE